MNKQPTLFFSGEDIAVIGWQDCFHREQLSKILTCMLILYQNVNMVSSIILEFYFSPSGICLSAWQENTCMCIYTHIHTHSEMLLCAASVLPFSISY